MLNGEGAEVLKTANAGLTCSAGDHLGLAASVLKLSEMSNEEREVMGRNGLNVSAREFDRDTLIDRLEGWLEKLNTEGLLPSESRDES
jgi:glycosyltransferase involved in cell wall biosynthesis